MSILQKNKKLAAGIGVAAVAAAALALGAGTYAAFIDTEAVPANTFAAGSLNLVLGGEVTAAPFEYSNLKPGSERTQTITIDNTGTLDGTLSFSLAVTGAENSCEEPETDIESTPCDTDSELTEVLEISVNGAAFVPLTSISPIDAGPLTAAGGATSYPITVRVPAGAGNDIMTDSTTITATATLTQS